MNLDVSKECLNGPLDLEQSSSVACVAADSFPFSGGAEIEQANEKRASEGARLG